MPPVGKSGPGRCAMSSALLHFGCAIRCSSAAQISPGLCGGMLVAMPTAMPAAPVASRVGGRADALACVTVIGLAELDGVLVDAVEHRPRYGRKAALGVPHRRSVIAID